MSSNAHSRQAVPHDPRPASPPVSLAQTGSFSQSAAALFLTQPALSRSIRALEDELGQPLFDRIGRRSELTPFGREAVRARARAGAGRRRPARQRPPAPATARKACCASAWVRGPGAMLMTPLLLKMAQERPRLRVEIARAGTELLVQALRERTLDALVVDARSLRPGAGPARAVPARDARRLHGAPRPSADAAARRRRASTTCCATRWPRRRCPTRWRACWSSATGRAPTRASASRCAARRSPAWSRWRATATPCCWRSARPRPTWSS